MWEADDKDGDEGSKVRGRMPTEFRGLGVVAGVRIPVSLTSDNVRRVREAGLVRCGVGTVTWVEGILSFLSAMIGLPVVSSSSSSSSTRVCSSALLAIEAWARLLPKLSRFPARELRFKFPNDANEHYVVSVEMFDPLHDSQRGVKRPEYRVKELEKLAGK